MYDKVPVTYKKDKGMVFVPAFFSFIMYVFRTGVVLLFAFRPLFIVYCW